MFWALGSVISVVEDPKGASSETTSWGGFPQWRHAKEPEEAEKVSSSAIWHSAIEGRDGGWPSEGR
jgi:hypothetical protein|tara:strand:+ start:245 stop:442 length:198 start_codon:yes stop_codon:yes gene_type:complete